MSMLVEVVTTFNKDGFEQYGEQFLHTFKKHWHGDILLTIYAEGFPGDMQDGERIRWRSYEESCPKGVEFKARTHPDPPIVEANRYRYAVNKFSHKSFALADAMRRTKADCLVLIDADIETYGNVTPEWVKLLLWHDGAHNDDHNAKHGAYYQYGPEHVRRLYRMVKRNLSVPFTFHVVTDQPGEIFGDGVDVIDIAPWRHIIDRFGRCYVKLSIFGLWAREYFGDSHILTMDLDLLVLCDRDWET